ncbi:unnamed protein product [Lota lota]
MPGACPALTCSLDSAAVNHHESTVADKARNPQLRTPWLSGGAVRSACPQQHSLVPMGRRTLLVERKRGISSRHRGDGDAQE